MKSQVSLLSASLVSLLVSQFVLFGALFPVLPVSPEYSMRYAIALVGSAFVMCLASGERGCVKVMVLAIMFAISIALVPIRFKGYDSFLLTMVFSWVLGYLAYKHFKSESILLYIYGLLSLYLSAYYLRHGGLDDALYTNLGGAVAGVSRNYVGILLLQIYLVYYAVCVRREQSPKHWPIFVLPIISVMASGVGSTLIAVLLMTGYILRGVRVRASVGISLALGLVVMLYTFHWWLSSTLFYERLLGGDFIVSRVLLWSDFFVKLDSQSVFVGFAKDVGFIDHEISLNEVPNLHNSYLNLYKRVGIFSFVYDGLLIYLVSALFSRNAMLGWIFLCALLRAVTDGYFFSTFLIDFIFFYLLMLTPLGLRLIPTAEKGAS